MASIIGTDGPDTLTGAASRDLILSRGVWTTSWAEEATAVASRPKRRKALGEASLPSRGPRDKLAGLTWRRGRPTALSRTSRAGR